MRIEIYTNAVCQPCIGHSLRLGHLRVVRRPHESVTRAVYRRTVVDRELKGKKCCRSRTGGILTSFTVDVVRQHRPEVQGELIQRASEWSSLATVTAIATWVCLRLRK